MKMTIRVCLILTLLLFSSSFLQVTRCEPDPDVEVVDSSEEGGDLGIVGEDVQDFGGGSFSPAPGVETVCVFPQNPQNVSYCCWTFVAPRALMSCIFIILLLFVCLYGRIASQISSFPFSAIAAGEESELLVGIKNEGESSINVIAIQASVHLPFDHRYLIQNLSAQAFRNASVPPSAQATFPYIFCRKQVLTGEFDLVGTIVYEIDQNPYQSTFFNGTVEVTEVGGLFSVESVFLFCLGVALLALLGFWIRSQIQNLSKKTKRVTKVEVGTAKTDASMDEWLQETGPKGFGQQQLGNLILVVFPRILGNRHGWDQESQPLRSRDSCLRCSAPAPCHN
ncbi:UNVERIFIED_CONTAM: Translocon-associated protein subunit alpha [Sesamum latifolium]|uniref:Translocon-associated protein subunit alpha n=1 Tax=Sesamum latifolium TaxID=2727402 RepID=A0AAW2XPG8_9LAMI